ncbi:MAG: DUF1569 domain-containing protein [Parafilimonas sp.]
MKSILNEEDYTEIKNRIQKLPAASIRRWGKMDMQQMLIHCTIQLKLAVGEIPSQTQGSSFMRSGLGKLILFSNMPWPKGASTPAEMNAASGNFLLTDIETEKKELLDYLEKAKGKEQLLPHPFFGNLNRKEWTRLIYKHLDHQTKQQKLLLSYLQLK